MKDDMKEQEPEVEIEETGEDNLDEISVSEEETHSQSKIKQLQAKLKECEAAKSEHLEALQRAKAEFLNARKRLEADKERVKEKLITEHITKLLPLCDSFHMAMSNESSWNAVDAEWRKGVESIATQLHKILEAYGVSAIDPLGEEFDPAMHEALAEVPVETVEQDHQIMAVIQKGYARTIEDKTELIRPARVSVGVFEN